MVDCDMTLVRNAVERREMRISRCLSMRQSSSVVSRHVGVDPIRVDEIQTMSHKIQPATVRLLSTFGVVLDLKMALSKYHCGRNPLLSTPLASFFTMSISDSLNFLSETPLPVAKVALHTCSPPAPLMCCFTNSRKDSPKARHTPGFHMSPSFACFPLTILGISMVLNDCVAERCPVGVRNPTMISGTPRR